MYRVTNLTGSKKFSATFDEREIETNEKIDYAMERWELAVETSFLKQLQIVEKRDIVTNRDVTIDLPETLTLFVPRVERGMAAILDELIIQQRVNAIQVVSVLPPPAKIPSVSIPPKHAGLLFIPSEEDTIMTSQFIHYHALQSIDDFQDLIDPLLKRM